MISREQPIFAARIFGFVTHFFVEIMLRIYCYRVQLPTVYGLNESSFDHADVINDSTRSISQIGGSWPVVLSRKIAKHLNPPSIPFRGGTTWPRKQQ
jgi:hypothetical protein